MFNFLLAASGCSSAANCYDWPIISQIIELFGLAVKYLYMFLEMLNIPSLGLTIILLTLIIKFIMLPLTIRQQKLTKLSSVAQPEISAIQKKYQGFQGNQEAMVAMQAETKAVYAKYGISQTGGCLQTFITLPIMSAFYGVIRYIPKFIDSFRYYYVEIINIIDKSNVDVTSVISNYSSTLTEDGKLELLCMLTNGQSTKGTGAWTDLINLFSGSTQQAIQTNYDAIVEGNTFLGINLLETPWNLIKGGGIGILAVLIPIICAAATWFSFKLTQNKSTAQRGDPTAATGKMMELFMPAMTLWFGFILNAGTGLYLMISYVFQFVLQVFINRHYRKIDMEAFVKENMEKAAEKAKKKGEKTGSQTPMSISQAAAMSTKNISSAGVNNFSKPKTISEIAKLDVSDNGNEKKAPPAPNSLAAKVYLVQQYNQEHESDDDNNGKKKYKK